VAQVAGVQIAEPVTNFLSSVTGVSDISTDLLVVGTNLTLALITLLIVLLATTIFNATLKENAAQFDGAMSRFTNVAGVSAFGGWFAAASTNAGHGWLGAAKPLGVTVVTGALYALVQPDFGFNEKTLVLMLALAAAVTITTFVFEGGQVVWSTRRFATPATMRIFPVGIAIALASVALTRFTNLHPGVIFGFVAAAAIAPRHPLSKRDEGLIVLVPLAGLLLASVTAFLLIDPLRDFEEANPGAWGALPVTIAVAVFVGGAEGALLSLLPLTFNDGQKIWQWSRLAWFALALPATFAFIHVVVNEEDYESLTKGRDIVTLLIVSCAVLTVAVGVWLFFRLRRDAVRP
jgi:hypothetical protein